LRGVGTGEEGATGRGGERDWKRLEELGGLFLMVAKGKEMFWKEGEGVKERPRGGGKSHKGKVQRSHKKKGRIPVSVMSSGRRALRGYEKGGGTSPGSLGEER